MPIASVATEYVFTDFLLKEPSTDGKYKGARLDLALDKLVLCIAVGLPLLLISLAFAQEVSVGTQISCFSPTNFSWRQAAFVDAYCWADVQKQDTGGLPLSMHKFFPYILLFVAMLVYVPALFWRFTVTPDLFSDLSFIMEELDRSYNSAIKLARRLHGNASNPETNGSVPDLTDTCFKYPLVEQYLRTKRLSFSLLLRYLLCRAFTFLALILACVYLCYYIRLSVTDEFQCNIRSGVLFNDSSVPEALQCKLVAVGVFQLLSYINLIVYFLLAPTCVYAMLVPLRCSTAFLKPYEMLPTLGVMEFGPRNWNDLAMYLLFLEENLSELKSYKCLKSLGQVKTEVDGKVQKTDPSMETAGGNCVEMKEVSPLLTENKVETSRDDTAVRQRIT
ncbi:Pannexin-1 [Bagarius yarrelli]|uniref:Pannexin n=1 Tax=Bagarius yarrelli TaxID=175774 RepID=A0A556TWG5_BAGYA|nr:Pannexin-1 [Bagarius yarrelli]